MELLKKIVKNNFGALLAIFGASAAVIRLSLSTLRIVLPAYNHIWYTLTVVFNGINIIIAFVVVKHNLGIIAKNRNTKK